MNLTPSSSLWSRFGNFASLFASPLRASHYAELLNPLWASHSLRARVERLHDETPDCRTLTLAPGRGFRAHRAGQHVRVGVTLGGMRHTRTYSISSSADRSDGRFTITVKAHPHGRVSRFLAHQIEVGDYLSLSLPQGDFTLPDARPARPLLITAGSGITPIMSMLRTHVTRGTMPDAVHLHYAPTLDEMIFGEELDELARTQPRYRLARMLTRSPSACGRSLSGHFSPTQLQALCPDWRDREVWVCGPQALIDAVQAHYAAAGLSGRVHTERFTAPRTSLPADAAGGRVHFANSERAAQADGRMPLLQVAEGSGLNPPHGCRMGICHSCDTRLVSGCVRDLRTGELLDEPGQTVQVCVCAAAGDVVLDL